MMRRFFVLLIAGALLFPACTVGKWISTPVVNDRDYIVSLEQHREKGVVITGKYDHPHEISPVHLARIMADLTYLEETGLTGRKTTMPVFQTLEIERLAPTLTDALKTADDSQRIRFVSCNRGKAWIFTVNRETEGVLFIEPDRRLNLAFFKINHEIDPETSGASAEKMSRADPLKIKSAGTALNPAAAYMGKHRFDNGRTAPLWVVADIDALKQAAAETAATAVDKSRDRSQPVTAAEPSWSETPAVLSQPATAAPEATAPERPYETALQEEIKNKLKYLKELLDDGLISEQDYAAKKAQLLEKIR